MSINPTPFQIAVWEAIQQIPKGTVTTYKEIARTIGHPNATRAVGTAVGKNQNAPHIPCHRVVKSTGEIGNYSGPGGVQKKIWLLQKEGIIVKKGRVHSTTPFFRFVEA